jgi:hypothetical protein
MHHLTRRTMGTTACAALLLFGAAACGDDGDSGVDVDVDGEQVEENLEETGEDIREGAEDLGDTIDENVDLGDDAEQNDG